MTHNFDDFDMTIQPEELQCDNPIDEDFVPRWADEDEWEEDEDHEDWEGDEDDFRL